MAVVVIVSIEEALLLTSIGIHVGVVTIKDDMAGYSSVVGQNKHSHEHLLYAEKVIVRNHILEAAHGGRIKKAFLNILKNPIILGIAFGMVAALLSLDFPTIVDKTIDNVAKMATPLALIVLGAGFEGRKALAKIKPTLAASAIKLVIQPLLLLPVAAALGFTGEKMIAILIMLASPTTPSCYIMAKSMKNDGVLTASIIVTTTLLGAFTLTGWIYILKTMGLI